MICTLGKGAANEHRGRGLALGEWGKCADQSRDGSWRSGSEVETLHQSSHGPHGRERVTAARSKVSGIRILLPASSFLYLGSGRWNSGSGVWI